MTLGVKPRARLEAMPWATDSGSLITSLDLRSKSGIHRLVTALEERGFIRRLPNRAQVERILHFIERRWNSGLLEALVDETQEFSLFACQHWRFPSLPGLRAKQIMNGHYPFHMCSATI